MFRLALPCSWHIQFYHSSESVESETGNTESCIKVPLTINHRNITKRITRDDVDVTVKCNHKEADTRVVLHALSSEGPVIVKAKDKDILILMIYAYALKKPEAIWCMQIDHNIFVNIGKIAQFLDQSACLQLPAFHSLTGCDTTSNFYRISKTSVFEKSKKKQVSLPT